MTAEFARYVHERGLQLPGPARIIRAVLAVERQLIFPDVELHSPTVKLDSCSQSAPAGGTLARVGVIGLMNGILRNIPAM